MKNNNCTNNSSDKLLRLQVRSIRTYLKKKKEKTQQKNWILKLKDVIKN